jgi:membrane-bound lytic murein transglycosylase D
MSMNRNLSRFFGCAVLASLLVGCTPNAPVGATEGAQATAPALPAPAPEVHAAVQPAPNSQQQRVRALIRQVEDAYARGQGDYRKGRLPEAKQEFDLAVDLMLLSGIDIKSEPSLQEEFDRVIDGVNAMETEALKQGNGFVPPEEPTPAEAAEEATFVVDPNIVAKAKADLATTKSDLPLVVNDYVAGYINFFANTKKGHNTLLHSFQRGGRYKAMIQRVMAEEGVPQDLIYLAVAESSFNPRAVNRSTGAGGMWQFMPHDKFYGLASNAYVDERFDPEKSTRAYARYMKYIYKQLGDWYLSMAGYNWGTGNVQHAVQKTGYADFWELYRRNNLPAATKDYVPTILAAIIIANHPTQYGFDDVTLDAPVLTDTVTINYQVDLRLVSDIVGAPVAEMVALNPSLLRMVTPPDTAFDLHLPAGTGTLFEQRITAIPEGKRTGWRYHRVSANDTLATVARESHVAEAALAEANQLHEGDGLVGHEALVIPQAASAAPAAHAVLYTARKGDTLVTIADRFGVSLAQLRSWNRMSGIKVAPGRKLHVTESASAPSVAGRHHRGSHASAAETENAPEPSTTRKSTRKSHRGANASAPSADAKNTTRKSHKGDSAKDAKKESAKSREAAPSAKKSESGESKKSHAKNSSTRSGSTRKKQK